MDIKELNEALKRLSELDPAEVPELADQIVDVLAAQLETAEESEENPAG